MTVEVKIQFESLALAAAFMAQFRDGTRTPPLPEIKDTPAKDALKAAEPEKPKAEKAAAPATAKPAATEPTAAATPAAAPAVPYEKSGIPEKIATAVGAGKRAEAVALLAEFGAKKGIELKPADFAAFTVKIDAVLETAGAL